MTMQPTSKELIKEFNDQKAIAAIQQNPYRAVLAWFLSKFPKYDEYKEFFATTAEESAEEVADHQRVVNL